MADDPKASIDRTDPTEPKRSREDAETTAARRNLKQTSISGTGAASPDKSGTEDEATASDKSGERGPTPDGHTTEAESNKIGDKVSSPKKKRARDELDEPKDDAFVLEKSADSKQANESAASSRTDRSEPEKKRPRDESGTESSDTDSKGAEFLAEPAQSDKEKPDHAAAAVSDVKDKTDRKPPTSNSAFSRTGFAKLSGTTSGFGALGNSTKSSVFGGSSATAASPFATQGAAKVLGAAVTEPAKLVFGSKAGSASPFATAGLNGTAKGSPFGSARNAVGFGNASSVSGFGSALPRLGGLAGQAKEAGNALKTYKPARPFGAPDTDDEQDSEDGDDEAEDENGDVEQEREKTKDDAKSAGDDAKKLRLQRIVVDDGESSEATVLAVRAKMFQLDKVEGWKERGAGMLKLNVPKASLDFDESGNADMHTFDASALESKDGAGAQGKQSVRLLMRQDHTLRLILNTTVVPAIQFKLIPKLKAAHVLFTAFEADEVKQVQMKMSEANAKLFMDQIKFIQKTLADV